MNFRTTACCCIAVCLGSGLACADGAGAGARQVAVTYFTEPANASVYSPSDGLYGAAPLTLYYDLPPSWEGCLQLEPLQARWASGVESEVQLSVCPENGRQQHYTFVRPDQAGLDVDVWFADKVEQLAMVDPPGSTAKDPASAATVAPLDAILVSCNGRSAGEHGCL